MTEKILIRDCKNKVVAFIEKQKNGSWGYAFGSPKQSNYIMFYVDSLEVARERIMEII